MKLLIYANKSKDVNNEWVSSVAKILSKQKIEYFILTDEDLSKTVSADGIIILGGDGTILDLAEFVSRNGIPVIGINAGKVGFLTEFEKDEAEIAIELFKQNKFFKDERNLIRINFEDEKYFALNDVFIQRIFNDVDGGIVLDYSVSVDGAFNISARGDGVILSTPTGSTAYSLSCGGSVLAPDAEVFSVMPISSRPLYLRPFVFPTDKKCVITVLNDISAGLFIDGKKIKNLTQNQKIECLKSEKKVVFLRKKNDLYSKIIEKLYGNDGRGI